MQIVQVLLKARVMYISEKNLRSFQHILVSVGSRLSDRTPFIFILNMYNKLTTEGQRSLRVILAP